MDDIETRLGSERPEVASALKSMNWEARLEQARAHRRAVLDRNATDDKRPVVRIIDAAAVARKRAETAAPAPATPRPAIDPLPPRAAAPALKIVRPVPDAPEPPAAAPAAEPARRSPGGRLALGFAAGLGAGVGIVTGAILLLGLVAPDPASQATATASTTQDVAPTAPGAGDTVSPASAPPEPATARAAPIPEATALASAPAPLAAPQAARQPEAATFPPAAVAEDPAVPEAALAPVAPDVALPGRAGSAPQRAALPLALVTLSSDPLPAAATTPPPPAPFTRAPQAEGEPPGPLAAAPDSASRPPAMAVLLRPAPAAPPAPQAPVAQTPERVLAVAAGPTAPTFAPNIPPPALPPETAPAVLALRAAELAAGARPAPLVPPAAEAAPAPASAAPDPRVAALDAEAMETPPAPRPLPAIPGAAALSLRIVTPQSVAPGEAEALVTRFGGLGIGDSRITPVRFKVSETHVRYYHPADAAAAETLAGILGTEARDHTAFRPRPPDGTVEVFLAGERASAPARTARTTARAPAPNRSAATPPHQARPAPQVQPPRDDGSEALRDRILKRMHRGEHL